MPERRGAKIGEHAGAVCYIGTTFESQLMDAQGDSEDPGWAEQFRAALTLEPEQDSNGKPIPLSAADYIMHFLMFFWKILCAFIPPRRYLGAWPAFVVSIIFIGIMTAVVEQLANLLGCSAGLKTAVTGITLVAVGTSLPDTFASRISAIQEDSADNSIGNITGSNSVNVFLGLGLPWMLSAIYAQIMGKPFCVSSANVFESVTVYLAAALVCLGTLLFLGGELGGKAVAKWLTSILILLLWLFYVTFSSLRAYEVIEWNMPLPASMCPNQ